MQSVNTKSATSGYAGSTTETVVSVGASTARDVGISVTTTLLIEPANIGGEPISFLLPTPKAKS